VREAPNRRPAQFADSFHSRFHTDGAPLRGSTSPGQFMQEMFQRRLLTENMRDGPHLSTIFVVVSCASAQELPLREAQWRGMLTFGAPHPPHLTRRINNLLRDAAFAVARDLLASLRCTNNR
jgi:hypothetical protein